MPVRHGAMPATRCTVFAALHALLGHRLLVASRAPARTSGPVSPRHVSGGGVGGGRHAVAAPAWRGVPPWATPMRRSAPVDDGGGPTVPPPPDVADPAAAPAPPTLAHPAEPAAAAEQLAAGGEVAVPPPPAVNPRKAAKAAAKAAARAKRAGGDDGAAAAAAVAARRKACEVCGRLVDMCIRCVIAEGGPWVMVCGRCWAGVSGGVVDGDAAHPHYRCAFTGRGKVRTGLREPSRPRGKHWWIGGWSRWLSGLGNTWDAAGLLVGAVRWHVRGCRRVLPFRICW